MENIWVPIALVCAFTLATSDAFTKKALSVYNEYLVAWLRLLLALPLLFLAFLFVPIPHLDRTFYTTFLIALPLEVAAFVLYIKALKLSPLSLTLPFLSLTPLFLIIVPYLILGESISTQGVIGVLLIAAGSYTLNIRDFKKGIFAPLIAITRERGSLYMLIVAIIYSFTATLAKKVVGHSSPVFASLVYYIALYICLTPIVLYKNREVLSEKKEFKRALIAVLPAGIFDAIAMLTNMVGFSLTKVAYLIAVKRLSLLIGVYYGYLFFKESGIRERFLGSVLMLAGFALIVLYH